MTEDYNVALGVRFRALKTGASKKKMIDELRELGEPRTADQLIEDWYTERTKWLSDKNLENKDIFRDESGRECYRETSESGTPGDNYQVDSYTAQIPEELDATYWLSK